QYNSPFSIKNSSKKYETKAKRCTTTDQRTVVGILLQAAAKTLGKLKRYNGTQINEPKVLRIAVWLRAEVVVKPKKKKTNMWKRGEDEDSFQY
ncbi:unnamed protein product, partial [Ceratitis capitata]